MIRTKEPQLIDAQNGTSEIIYFTIAGKKEEEATGVIKFLISLSVKRSEKRLDEKRKEVTKEVFVLFREVEAEYKKETFIKLFGDKTISQFEDEKYQMMIDQIAFINSYKQGEGEAKSVTRFWNLEADDLEVVPD